MKLRLSVIPKSGRSEVKIEGDKAKVWLKSVPEDGKANAELVRILAKRFDVPRANVKIVTGLSSRNKIVDIVGVTVEEIRKSAS